MAREIDREATFGQRDGAIERIEPGFFGEGIERQHLSRYRGLAMGCRQVCR